MNDYAQRRRVALAAAITVIAVPGVLLLNRDPDEPVATEPSMTLVGGVVDAAGTTGSPAGPSTTPHPATGDQSAETDPMGTAAVAYLEGSVPSDDGDPATIAIPRPSDGIEGTASFRRSISRVSSCYVRGAPPDAKVTVTNMDNSRSVTCIAALDGIDPADDVILHADAFAQIADLTDAPVPVEISW